MPDTIPAAAVQIPAAGIYQLDPAASTVTFATRHMFGLAPVKGTFRLVSGQITIADPVTSSTITEATASEDVLLIRATTRIDRYAHGLTKAKGIAGRHLAMEITARATRS